MLAMLSRLDYESLKGKPGAAARRTAAIGVLLREPAMADQLALIDAVLPQKRRLGVVATHRIGTAGARTAARRPTAGTCRSNTRPDAKSLAAALRTAGAAQRCADGAARPDRRQPGRDAGGAARGRRRRPAGVRHQRRAGALGRPGGRGLDARRNSRSRRALLGQKLAAARQRRGVLVEAATPATVRVNATVARGLGLRLPEERELTERLAAAR